MATFHIEVPDKEIALIEVMCKRASPRDWFGSCLVFAVVFADILWPQKSGIREFEVQEYRGSLATLAAHGISRMLLGIHSVTTKRDDAVSTYRALIRGAQERGYIHYVETQDMLPGSVDLLPGIDAVKYGPSFPLGPPPKPRRQEPEPPKDEWDLIEI